MQSVDGKWFLQEIARAFKLLLPNLNARINTIDGHSADPTDVSRGVYGATVGVDRLLRLWEKYGIKTSWYVPAHSIESFPEQMEKVKDAGHEM